MYIVKFYIVLHIEFTIIFLKQGIFYLLRVKHGTSRDRNKEGTSKLEIRENEEHPRTDVYKL